MGVTHIPIYSGFSHYQCKVKSEYHTKVCPVILALYRLKRLKCGCVTDFLFNDNASDTSLLPMEVEKTTCERQILVLCQQLPTKPYIKRYKLQVYKNNNCNLLQPSSSFSICASCGIWCMFYAFFNVLGADVFLNLEAVLTVRILIS